jgi:hypothetical protein
MKYKYNSYNLNNCNTNVLNYNLTCQNNLVLGPSIIDIFLNVYFRIRFGLVYSINTYLWLEFHEVLGVFKRYDINKLIIFLFKLIELVCTCRKFKTFFCY